MRPVVGVERQLVEASARWLAADMPMDLVLAIQAHGQRVDERLDRRLLAERGIGLAKRCLLTVDRTDCQPKGRGILFCQLRDVVRQDAAGDITGIGENIGQATGKIFEIRNRQVTVQRLSDKLERIGAELSGHRGGVEVTSRQV